MEFLVYSGIISAVSSVVFAMLALVSLIGAKRNAKRVETLQQTLERLRNDYKE